MPFSVWKWQMFKTVCHRLSVILNSVGKWLFRGGCCEKGKNDTGRWVFWKADSGGSAKTGNGRAGTQTYSGEGGRDSKECLSCGRNRPSGSLRGNHQERQKGIGIGRVHGYSADGSERYGSVYQQKGVIGMRIGKRAEPYSTGRSTCCHMPSMAVGVTV